MTRALVLSCSVLPQLPPPISSRSAAAAAAVSASPFARARRVPASDRITIGVIGWGMMGPANTKAFLGFDDCQVVAACDIEKNHLQTAVDTINTHYGNKDCAASTTTARCLRATISTPS